MQQPIHRRGFLGLVGAGAGGVLVGPETALALPVEPLVNLDAALDLEGILCSGAVAPPVLTAAGWDPDKLFNQSAATMMWAGRARRAATGAFQDVALDEAIDDRVDGMIRTVWAAALELDCLDDAEIADLERTIVKEAWVIDESRLKFTARALEHDVPLEDVGRIDRLFERALWRIEKQGLAAVRDDLIGRLDRVSKRKGFDWRVEARRGANQPFVRPDATSRGRARPEGRPPYSTSEEYFQLSRVQTNTGLAMLGIGVLWMAGPQIIFGGICFGPPLITIGIVKLVAAGRNKRAGRTIEAREGDTAQP